MITLRAWAFACLLTLYASYNLLWVIGIMSSFGKNDTHRELFYLVLTFIIDIPIVWFMTRQLKLGLMLFIVSLTTSVALGISLHVLNSTEVPALWYGPKILVVIAAIWAYRSTHPIAKSAEVI